ncbi:Potassium voltage-gated channel subfamily KQT; possible potassium channel, VIC family [hydrothermal vent metagenome]|uniref:Potassium voltage-gated channel subfamily KQT possible potassium channel, VIC family n=1 Tax=hydrothermal vent metagenome TaxID=652676 RepID=A0A3B0RE88_9ZZZZ
MNDSSSRFGRIFFFAIQTLIVFSLIVFSLDTLPNLSSKHANFLSIAETTTIIIFTIEYALRIFVAKKRIKFVFSFFGIVDLLAILPFYLPFLGLDLRVLRIVRLLRILKLFKQNKAINRFKRAWELIKQELYMFAFISSIMIFISAAGIYFFENQVQPEQFQSIFHSLWWAVTTLTTVGYGDMYPITTGGKIFTFVILMIGLGIVAVPTGLISSALTQVREEEANSK